MKMSTFSIFKKEYVVSMETIRGNTVLFSTSSFGIIPVNSKAI